MEFEKIAEIIASDLRIDVESIKPESTFESFKVDSLDMVEIIMDVESEFGITFEEDVKFQTVGEVADYIKAKKS